MLIPKLMGGAAAGTGGETLAAPLTLDRAGELAFSWDWLQRQMQHTSGKLATVQVVGDSMANTLLDGDTIIIDIAEKDFTVDSIYVIVMNGRRMVKRVQRKFDGSLVIISDNKAYGREAIPRAQAAEISVVGRMVWPKAR